MERRKFLIGAGSLAAGGAAALGSGAFSSVNASRTATVRVRNDENAYLGLVKDGNSNSEYADDSGAQMTVDLGASTSGGGSGVNQGAVTRIYDIFSIRNQGTNEALVYVDPNGESQLTSSSGSPASLKDQGAYDASQDGIYFDPQVSGMPNGRTDDVLGELPDGTLYTSLTGNGGSVNDFEEDVLNSNTKVPPGPAVFLLRPGEQFDFGAFVKTTESATGEINYDMTVEANAELAQKARQEGKMTVSQNM